MLFVLSKTAAFIFLPSNLVILAGLCGVVLMRTRWRRGGARLAIGSLLLLAAIGFLPVGQLLAGLLENRFPQWDASRGAPDGIIVLGGSIAPELSQQRGEAAVTSSPERLTVIGKLARDYPNARIVFTGGNAAIRPGGPAEADFVLPVFEQMGVARNRVMLERRSRNTIENAEFTKVLVLPKPGERWLLVTSAAHMPRSVGCFRQAGFPVEAYPVGWRAARGWLLPEKALSAGLARFDRAAHEWIGLIAYRLLGRTDALFPAPEPR